MAWGIFKKIGQGLKKGFNWVKDHIVKPVAKFVSPVAKAAAPVIGTFVPGAEKIIDTGAAVVDKIAGNNALTPADNMVGMNGHGIRKSTDDWTSAFDNSRILNQKIQLK